MMYSLNVHYVDTDECVDGTNNCDNEMALCVNIPGSFNCSCLPGFSGDGTMGNCEG